jgi:hypothetical protein
MKNRPLLQSFRRSLNEATRHIARQVEPTEHTTSFLDIVLICTSYTRAKAQSLRFHFLRTSRGRVMKRHVNISESPVSKFQVKYAILKALWRKTSRPVSGLLNSIFWSWLGSLFALRSHIRFSPYSLLGVQTVISRVQVSIGQELRWEC